ncbi:MAG: ATP-binding protein [Bryobacteraceae bacterium]
MDPSRWNRSAAEFIAAGDELIASLRAAIDDGMSVLGQTGIAWQRDDPTADRAGVARLEQLYRAGAAEFLEQPVAEWRRRKPVERALEAFQDYDNRAAEIVMRLPVSAELSAADIRILAPGILPFRWWFRRGKLHVPVRALAGGALNGAVARRGKLDGEAQLILAQAGLLVSDAWESLRRRTLSGLAGQEPPDPEAERTYWAAQAARLRDRAEALLTRYREWNQALPVRILGAVRANAPGRHAGAERFRRDALLDYWTRQQRAVHAFLDLETAATQAGLQCCAESRRATEALGAEHGQLRAELDAMCGWLHEDQGRAMPAAHGRLRSADERAEAWIAGLAQCLRARLPSHIELSDPRFALPPRFFEPWREVRPLTLFQRSLHDSARPEALEGFRAAESSHREIVREVERAREVIAFGEEARADADSEGAAIAREAASNAAQLLDHLRASIQDVRPGAERGVVRGQAAAFLDFHVAIDEGRLGLWKHLTRQRGLRASRDWRRWSVARFRDASRAGRKHGARALDWVLSAVGWTSPPRPQLEPVVERVELSHLIHLAAAPVAMPRLYRRLFRHEPVEDPRFLIGRENELAGFASAVAAFSQGRRTAVILVGARGSGKTSLLNCALSGVPPDLPVVRGQFGHRLSTAIELREFLGALLRIAPGADPLTALSERRRIIVLEELERSFIATMGGFAALRELISIVEATADSTFWVFSINESAFAYINAAVGLGRIFPLRINAMSVSSADLRRAILYRHHLSALRLQFAPVAARGPTAWVRHYLGIEDDPRDTFFESLHDQSEGVFRSALHLWAESIERIEGGVVFLRQLGEPGLSRLAKAADRLDAFALIAILRHGGLTPAELASILPDRRTDWAARCQRLQAMGLIEPDPTESGYRVASLAARLVRETLRRQNLE